MKKKHYIMIVIGIVFSLFCVGCGNRENEEEKSYADYPIYFQTILQQRDTGMQWFNEKDRGLKEYYTDSPEDTVSCGVSIESKDVWQENDYMCHIQWIKVGKKDLIQDLSFDFSTYMEKAECNHASVQGIFYIAEEDIIYVPICSMDNKEGYAWLLEFPMKAPNQYMVTEYPKVDAWFGGCFRLQNILFYEGGVNTAPWAINLKTKEAYHCTKEHEDTKKYAEEWVKNNHPEWGKAGVWWFYPRDIKDDVIIYEGDVQEDMDTEVIMEIYRAYEGEKLVATMLIDEVTGEILIE